MKSNDEVVLTLADAIRGFLLGSKSRKRPINVIIEQESPAPGAQPRTRIIIEESDNATD